MSRSFSYDPEQDQFIIEGIKFDGDFFKVLATPSKYHERLQIVKNEGGVVYMHKTHLHSAGYAAVARSTRRIAEVDRDVHAIHKWIGGSAAIFVTVELFTED